MNDVLGDGRSGIEILNRAHKSIGAWIVVTVLLSLLAASFVIAYLGLTLGDASVPTSGYVAMALGVIFSLVIGVGLMALLFYSSRKGFDEPAVLIEEPGTNFDDVQKPSSK